MKAIVHTRYGPAEELQLKELPKPVPGTNEVLVRIVATTVTTSDCNVRNFTFVPALFKPLARMMFGIRKPRRNILGIEFSGIIEQSGSGVKNYKTGDPVFGTPEPEMGTHTEYICLRDDKAMTLKPAGITWEEAATLPLAANTALYFIRDLAQLKAGQSILINGASGGIGTFAVQLARYYGAEVTAVCSGANLGMVQALGAHKGIDYLTENIASHGKQYDVIFDIAGTLSFRRCRHSLTERGIFLVNLIRFSDLLRMILTPLTGKRRAKGGMAVASVENLKFLAQLCEEGHLKPVIGNRYPLEQVAEAFRYVETGHKKGQVVIAVTKA